ARAPEVGRLDTRGVRLEGHVLVFLVPVVPRVRCGEEDGSGMQVGVAVRPGRLIRLPVEARRVGVQAAVYQDEGRRRRREAVVVVPVGRLLVAGRTLETAAACERFGDDRAVVEVADLVREGDVVGVRRPGNPRLL